MFQLQSMMTRSPLLLVLEEKMLQMKAAVFVEIRSLSQEMKRRYDVYCALD